MTTLNLEFGFNVPRHLIYTALIEPQYSSHYIDLSWAILALQLNPNPSKEDPSRSLKERSKESI